MLPRLLNPVLDVLKQKGDNDAHARHTHLEPPRAQILAKSTMDINSLCKKKKVCSGEVGEGMTGGEGGMMEGECGGRGCGGWDGGGGKPGGGKNQNTTSDF